MKQMGKQLKRKHIINISGITLVVCMLAAAFLLPELYFSYYDKSNRNQIEYLDAQMDTYQIQYEDFNKKLEALGTCSAEGSQLQATMLQETADLDTQIRLTDAANREFNQIIYCQPPFTEGDFSCYVTDLKSCELYTAYPKENGEDQFKGFVFWKLIYGMEDQYEIRLVLDAEFEKIISCCIWDNMTQLYYEDKPYLSSYIHDMNYEMQSIWLWGMVDYYGADEIAIFWGKTGRYMDTDLTEEVSQNKEDAENRIWIEEGMSGCCIFEYPSQSASELVLEYYLWGYQERGYYVMGFSCLNHFLQL